MKWKRGCSNNWRVQIIRVTTVAIHVIRVIVAIVPSQSCVLYLRQAIS